jgi:hypothetical protein
MEDEFTPEELEEIEEEAELLVDDCYDDCKKCIYAMTCTKSTYHPTREDWQWREWAKGDC